MAPREARHYKGGGRNPSTLQTQDDGVLLYLVFYFYSLGLLTPNKFTVIAAEAHGSVNRTSSKQSHPHIQQISPDFQVNDRKQKRGRETGDPLVQPAKHLEKQQHDCMISGENTVSKIKKTRSTNAPRVAQAVTPEVYKTGDLPAFNPTTLKSTFFY
ncbi:hypothetical protein GX50_01875 [[Emmonsia] crescens]|uniref:Uncharacterized protein n=1 Tax=[Emmonsia] crescens TaxID=73230 RepID=A0A2B7ZNT0_9EURO|nr:hypothetical protein GX50_01875 [Emmonsia crescens]